MPAPPNEQIEERDQGLADRLGVSRFQYLQAIQTAVTFTRAAQADDNPNLRPWRQWGARNLGGRIRALVQNPRNPSQMYAGSAQGGVFRTRDGGDTWQPVGKPEHSFPVGALALAPDNPNLLYVGTGEAAVLHDGPFAGPPASRAAREAFAAGLGLWRYDASADTYTRLVDSALALPGTAGAANSFAAIVIDPHDAQRCWLATHTGLWRHEAVAPQFQREQIPQTPEVPAPAVPAPPRLGACVTDVVLLEDWNLDRPRTYRLFAAVAGIGVYRGVFDRDTVATTWDRILGGGLPGPGGPGPLTYDRIRIVASAGFPNHVYAAFEKASDHSILDIYHSADGGEHWQRCAGPGDLGEQAWCNLCIAVHSNDPGVVVVGNVNVARSLDFGAHWETIIDWQNHTPVDRAQHGDNHVLRFDVREPNRLWVGNDGGISVTPDVVNVNPLTARTWRKQSHGMCASQFNDITVHPQYPFMMGGGLQDNATYLTFGGPTWAIAGLGDGGQMCFELQNPRQFVCPLQSNGNPRFVMQASVVAGSTVKPVPLGGSALTEIVRTPLPDLPATTADVLAIQVSTPVVPAGLNGLFMQNVLHHPSQAGNVMIGRSGDLAFSTDGGANYTAAGLGAMPGVGAGTDVTALAYGPGDLAVGPPAPPQVVSDWWAGTANGRVLRGTGATAAGPAWVAPPPGSLPGLGGTPITSIAVHPANRNYVVFATGGISGGNPQGRVFLTDNAGARWMEITGLGVAFDFAVGAPGGAVPGTLRSLPPSPVSGLAFDPTVPAANPQVLYAGTLGGVFVIRNLPPLTAVPAMVPFRPDWRTFNGTADAPLPLTLVNDLEVVRLPARGAETAGKPETKERLRLYAAMYGRGLFVSDISHSYPAGVTAGGPAQRLVIRQHSIEDGLAYPRPLPTDMNAAPAAPTYNLPQMNGDPRVPPLTSPFDDLSALDIRVDNAPFQFFDEVLDGVEFDEELHTKNVVPGQRNVVYVQIHNAGWGTFKKPVDVHLFFAPGAAPGAVPDPDPLPNLHPNFWSNFRAEPRLPPASGPLGPGAAQWQRTGRKQVIPANRLSAIYPAVVRFEWTPPADLATAGHVGLLAVCTGNDDALPAGTLPLNMRALVRSERRVAFRLVQVDPYVPDVFIRDSAEDAGLAASGGPAGRSPDIIVVQAAVANPTAAFSDLLDTHAGDRVRPGSAQIIYVRVFNRRQVPVAAQVDVLWTKPNVATAAGETHGPAFDGTKWAAVTPVGTATVTVPAGGWTFASVSWQAADVPAADATPGAYNAIGLIALVSSSEGQRDRAPQPERVRDARSFWEFFARTADSNNAAFRGVLYGS